VARPLENGCRERVSVAGELPLSLLGTLIPVLEHRLSCAGRSRSEDLRRRTSELLVIRPELGWTMPGRIKSNFPQPELSGVMLEKANYQTPKTRKADKLRHGKALQNGTLANLGS
jgi:hypothetical protein